MARYVGAAVATALTATIYGSVTATQRADGASAADALASGLAAASWVMVVFSALGILLALVAIRRFRAEQGTMQDAAASAAAHLHTLPTTAARARSAAPSGQDPSEGVSRG
jgi:heme/copper-type cytochrome/quinol oxidase subunit 2